jgi:predicted secreted protein
MNARNPLSRQKVALLANCLLNQNAKVCEGAHYRGVVSPVVEALRTRGYTLLQLPCPSSPLRVYGAGGPSMSNTTLPHIGRTAAAWLRRSRPESRDICARARRSS